MDAIAQYPIHGTYAIERMGPDAAEFMGLATKDMGPDSTELMGPDSSDFTEATEFKGLVATEFAD